MAGAGGEDGGTRSQTTARPGGWVCWPGGTSRIFRASGASGASGASELPGGGGEKAERGGFVRPEIGKAAFTRDLVYWHLLRRGLTAHGYRRVLPVVTGHGGGQPGQNRDNSPRVWGVVCGGFAVFLAVAVLATVAPLRVIYACVAPIEPDAQEALARQVDQIKAAVRDRGLDADLFEVVTDIGHGLDDTRPGYAKILEAGRRGEVKALAFTDRARLSWTDSCWRLCLRIVMDGGEVISLADDMAALPGIIEAVRTKTLRCRRNPWELDASGRPQKTPGKGRRLRGYPIVGRIAYGYRWAKSKAGEVAEDEWQIEIDPEEAEVVRRIFTWYGQEDMTSRQIASRLNREGVRRPYQSQERWPVAAIRYTLRNETYTGRWVARKTNVSKKDGGTNRSVPVPRDRQVILDCPELGIVTQEQWERCRAKRKRCQPQYLQEREPPTISVSTDSMTPPE